MRQDGTRRRARLYRFEPFELDVRAGELRKHGIRLRLREQPLRILLLLLEHPGEVILRAEIRDKLWPNQTVVEFDHGINAAMRKLRDALSESAEQPRYVETVGRRGYRFLAQVEMVEETSSEPTPPAMPELETDDLEGKSVSHYLVFDKLGSGGMGVVFRARDQVLKRNVALKFLSEDCGRLEQPLERFQQEARATAALNHPNICTVYEIGEHQRRPFIAMELLEGQGLNDILAEGPLPIDEIVALATQIASALNAAHRSGIIHRDIKPANLFVTRSGQVKILDFGLAKLLPEGPLGTPKGAVLREAATAASEQQTRPSSPVGTVAYMSPEQLLGEAVDARSDLFSLGVVLYEMAAGKPAFGTESSAETMNAILSADPPDLPDRVPASLKRIMRRCLEKDAQRRFHSAAELGMALQASLGSLVGQTVKARKWTIWAIGAVAAAATGMVFLFGHSVPSPRVRGITQLTRDGRVRKDAKLPLLTDSLRIFFWATDNEPAYQVSVKGGDSVPLPLQPVGGVLEDISPDKTQFLLGRGTSAPAELWVEPVVGGSRRRLGNLLAESAVWSPDGNHLAYVRDQEVHLASRDGAEIRQLAKFGGHIERPCWSPDGRKVRFPARSSAVGAHRLWEVGIDGGGLHEVRPGWHPSSSISSCAWTPDSKYFFFEVDHQEIWAARERPDWLGRASLQPVQLNAGQLVVQHMVFGSDSRRLFFEGFQDRNEFLRYDLQSGRFSLELPGISGTQLEYSRDGKWIAYVSVPGRVLYRASADGRQRLQLSPFGLWTSAPRWSPDGKQIAFNAKAGGGPERVFVVPFAGGEARQVSHGEASQLGDWSTCWSPDGRLLAFGATIWDAVADQSIHVLDVKTGRVSALPGSEGMSYPNWSPDGRYIAGNLALSTVALYDVQTQRHSVLFDKVGKTAWSQDGAFLFVHTDAGWFRLRMRDRKAELVNDLADIALADWGFYTTAPNNSLIAARDIGLREIYAMDLDLP